MHLSRTPVACAIVVLLSLAVPSGATAQEPTDSLRAEVERLAALVDSLSREVARLTRADQEPEAEDALARLRAAAAAAGQQTSTTSEPEDPEFVGRQRSLQALNPEISVNADLFGHLNKDDVEEENFFPREALSKALLGAVRDGGSRFQRSWGR